MLTVPEIISVLQMEKAIASSRSLHDIETYKGFPPDRFLFRGRECVRTHRYKDAMKVSIDTFRVVGTEIVLTCYQYRSWTVQEGEVTSEHCATVGEALSNLEAKLGRELLIPR
jgi:hypothetical protein